MGCTLSQPTAARMGLDRDRAARRRTAARLAALRTREGLIPVCGWCRKVRTESGHWASVESCLLEQAGANLTHGVCPDCAQAVLGRRHDAA